MLKPATIRLQLLLLSIAACLTCVKVFAEINRSPPYQKPGADIRIISPLKVQLDENSRHTVTIELSTPTHGYLSLETKVEEGISVQNLEQRWTGVVSGTTLAFETHIQSGDPGRYQIMFHAKVTQGEHSSSRVFGLPVYVGEIMSEKSKDAPQYIHLPAQEKVRPQY